VRELFSNEKNAEEAAKNLAIEYAMYNDNGALQREEPRKVYISEREFEIYDKYEREAHGGRYRITLRRMSINKDYPPHNEETFAKEGSRRLNQFQQVKNSINQKTLLEW